MKNTAKMWNSKLFSTSDLERFTEIEGRGGHNSDEAFLVGLVEKLFTEATKLKEYVTDLEASVDYLDTKQEFLS